MDEILKIGINKEKIYLANDAVLAFYAQADSPGLVIVAGTGSIILGIKEDGEIYRVGGWGYNFSDLGSGYDIGRKLLKKYCFIVMNVMSIVIYLVVSWTSLEQIVLNNLHI